MVLGIVISVGILSAGMNLFEGYETTLRSLLLDSIAHINVQSSYMSYMNEDDTLIIKRLIADNKDIVSSYWTLSSGVIAMHDGHVRGSQLRAYEEINGVLPYKKYVSTGKSTPSNGQIIVGHYLARDLGLDIGDSLTVMYPQINRLSAMGLYPSSKDLQIVGLYRSGYYELDRSLIIAHKSDADALLSTASKISAYEIKLKPQSLDKADHLAKSLEQQLGVRYLAVSWMQYNQGLLSLITMEKWLLFIVFSFLVMIAGLNVISTISTVMYDANSEIALLLACGATHKAIGSLLNLRIAVVCIFSVVSGQLLGALVSWMVVKQSFYHLKGDVYFIDRLTLHISIQNQFIIFACAAVIVLMCIKFPLSQLRKLNVIQILRYR